MPLEKQFDFEKNVDAFAELAHEIAVIIRILDYAQHEGFDVAGGMVQKHFHNTQRPKLHGKEF